MPRFTRHGRTIAFDDRGTGSAVVFQHGLGSSREQALDALSGVTNRRVIAMDAPSHGESEDAPELHSFESMGDVVVALLDHLAVERAVLGGISMGSGMGLGVALQSPDRVSGLLLIRPAWLDRPHPPNLRIIEQVGGWMCEAGVDAARLRLHGEPFFRQLLAGNPLCAASIEGVLDQPGSTHRGDVLRAMVASAPIESLEQLRRIDVPALVVANEADPLHPVEMARSIADALPRASLHIAPRRYVEPVEHRRVVCDLVRTFLDDLADGTGDPSLL